VIPIHIDYITIPGATVKDLHHAFLSEYGNVHRPIDVLLVAGLNVRSICIIDETWSSFAVATLPFPPKLVEFDAETRNQTKSSTNLKGNPMWNIQSNYIQILIDLTTSIRELTKADSHPMIPTNLAPCFHTWGILQSDLQNH